MKPCPNCKEECVLAESALAELIPLGFNGTLASGAKEIFKEYHCIGIYYYHANGKICVKDCAEIVDLATPTFRTLREPRSQIVNREE